MTRPSSPRDGELVRLFGLWTGEPLSSRHWWSHDIAKKRAGGLQQADTIIIPGWRNPDEVPPQRLIRALLKAHKRGASLVSICSGVFVLGATGLMSGRRATTHWRYIDKLAHAFPLIKLQADVL